MTVSLFTISIVGFLAGFFFSMPIAGPISILITSNALKGRLRYCQLATLGSSVADFIYVFIAVFGLTRFYNWYKPGIPYVLLVGAVFLFYIGYKVFRTHFDLDNIEDKSKHAEKIKSQSKGAFYAGFMINFLNPTLLINWLTSSFFVISFVTSIGYDMGGLYSMVDNNVKVMNHAEGNKTEKKSEQPYFKFEGSKAMDKEVERQMESKKPAYFPLLASSAYAVALAFGSIVWFYLLAIILIHFRSKIKLSVIHFIVRGLAIILFLMGIYFGYTAIRLIFKIGTLS
jgi:threonine/homoserine/homoserine lactone efflux protein